MNGRDGTGDCDLDSAQAWAYQMELEYQQMQEECFQVLHQQKETEHEME